MSTDHPKNTLATRKKVDPRVRILLENSVKSGHRSFIVMIGDRGKEQAANLHYMLTKSQVAKRPTVLWCFKKELEFSSHRKKRMKQLKKTAKGLKREPGERLEDDPFELFLSATAITYCYYHETDRILGCTYGMCILQDFEALTPNLLARTIETVQGGGLVVLLLKTLSSLKQLYTMTMDVHARYRTESLQHDPVARFNERFLLSLPTCCNCLVVNDQLDVLPITGPSAREIQPITQPVAKASAQLESLQVELMQKQPDTIAAKLVNLAKTMDQANAIRSLVDTLSAQPLRTTISLTAGRGRGKSAALGVALAAALHSGYANLFITSPSPENLKTVFEFLFKGLDALGYEEHLDYDVIQSTQPELSKCIVRVNVHRSNQHRQTVLYIHPEDGHLLGQAELVAIDEAAAIPLPLVQSLSSGPQTVLMSSTINGYEGTGRSLSLKLLADLRKPSSSRALKELALEEPIRYNPGDPVEGWLNKLLCLDVTASPSKMSSTLPDPGACHLFLINRDTLFSFHKAAEAFLQRLISLYVASHYKNSPNDLQLMSDAPGHLLFVLLGPEADAATSGLPDILCFVQVCLEGQLTRQSVLNSLSRGKRAAGDLIPWTVSQQFQDDAFARLSGARIVRIAVNPDCQGMGYGSRAMALLEDYFCGKLLSIDDPVDYCEQLGSDKQGAVVAAGDDAGADISTEVVKPRSNLPPLLTRLDQVRPVHLHWLGVSFGLTGELWKFYRRLSYLPVYLRQTANDITGEHTVIVLKSLQSTVHGVHCAASWLDAFNDDFCRRFVSLLSFCHFRKLPVSVCLSLLSVPRKGDRPAAVTAAFSPTPFDLKRLESYANNLLDYHMVTDLLPDIARQHFLAGGGGSDEAAVALSPVQSAILLAMGLQRKTVDDVERELKLPASQVLAMFSKTMRKFVAHHRERKIADYSAKEGAGGNGERRAGQDDNAVPRAAAETLPQLDDELADAADDAKKRLKRKQRELVDSLDMSPYEIGGNEKEWSEELGRKAGNLDKITVSIPSSKPEKDSTDVAKTLYKKHVAEPMEARARSRKLKRN